MTPVIWTARGRRDMDRLHRFLRDKNPRAAQRAIAEIHRAAVLVSAFPNAGRPLAELDANHREMLIPFGDSGYAMIYLFDGATIEVLAIRHQREAGY